MTQQAQPFRSIGFFGARIDPKVLDQVDKIREGIPRSRIIERALIRYIDDIKNGKVSILQGASSVGSHIERQADTVGNLTDNHPAKEAVAGVT